MTGWLKSLFGGTAKPQPKKKAVSKTYNAPSNRAELLAEAMSVHQRQRAQAQGALEAALAELKAKPPKPSDIEAMTRMLTLRQAVLKMKANIASDSQRPKVLEGVRGLMGPPRKPTPDEPKR
jgi:hypothetical protein